MKTILTLLLLATLGFAQEVRRPQADSDAGNNIAFHCTGTNLASTAMTLAHDSAGITTSSTQSTSGGTLTSNFRTRKFTSWQSTGNTYTGLTLKISSQSDGWSAFEAGRGAACAVYSIDSGSSWSTIRCDVGGDGWDKTTNSITLTSTQDLAKLQVGVCTQGNRGSPSGADTITVFDIWTEGTTTSNSSSSDTGSTSGNSHRGIVFVN